MCGPASPLVQRVFLRPRGAGGRGALPAGRGGAAGAAEWRQAAAAACGQEAAGVSGASGRAGRGAGRTDYIPTIRCYYLASCCLFKLDCIVLYHVIVRYYIVLYHVSIKYCIVLYRVIIRYAIVLYHVILRYCIVSYNIIFYYTILYNSSLCYVISYVILFSLLGHVAPTTWQAIKKIKRASKQARQRAPTHPKPTPKT